MKRIKCIAKCMVSLPLNIYMGFWIILLNLRLGSERIIMNAPFFLAGSSSMAFVYMGPFIMLQSWYGIFWLSLVRSSLLVSSEPSLWWYIRMLMKASWVWPSLGTKLKIFRPKGLRIALQYFWIRFVLERPVRVMVKLEDSRDHHHPTRMEIRDDSSPTACLRHASMAFTIV